MKVQYFAETDTLYIEFRTYDVVESKDLSAHDAQTSGYGGTSSFETALRTSSGRGG